MIKNKEEMLELAENIKPVITIFYMFKKLSRHMEDIEKTQNELIEIKTTICNMKYILDGINSKLDVTKEHISDLEGIAIETT